MLADSAIVELVGQTFPPAEKVQRSGCPVRAAEYLGPRVTFALVRSPHRQKVPDGHVPDGLLSALRRVFREKRKHLVINAAYLPLIDGDADQKPHDAFCR